MIKRERKNRGKTIDLRIVHQLLFQLIRLLSSALRVGVDYTKVLFAYIVDSLRGGLLKKLNVGGRSEC